MIFAAILALLVGQEAQAVTKGAHYLVESQDRDGSWYPEIGEGREPGMRIAVTALCMHALVASDPSAPSIESARRGLAFIKENLNSLDGPFEVNPQFNFNPWGVCFALIHLHGVSKRWPAGAGAKLDLAAVIDSLVKKAEKTQLPCGGWTYLKKNEDGSTVKDGSVSFLTASMIEGLLRWKGEGHKLAEKLLPRAVADLEKILGTKEGLPYSHTGDYQAGVAQDHALRTVQARLALLEAGKGTPQNLEESVRNFFKVREQFEKLRNTYGHTPPTMIAGYYYYFGHLHVARAVRKLGLDTDGQGARLRSIFLKEQLEDGSWRDVAAGGKNCGTGMVLLSLDELGALPWRESLDVALKAAKEESKPLLVYFTDGRKDAADTEKALRDPTVRELLQSFACARIAIAKDEPACGKAKVTSGCALLILDAGVDDPFEKPLKKWTGKQGPKSLREGLAKALKDRAK